MTTYRYIQTVSNHLPIHDRGIYYVHRSIYCVLIVMLALLSGNTADLHAQRYPNSPVFRNYRAPRSSRPSERLSYYKQLNTLMLLTNANNGDPNAQHEVGLRYLTGVGLPADTVKSAEWVRKAAEQNLVPARYNYGLLQNNGWGVEWNPYESFENFRYAAEKEMPEAQYIVGLFYTDNLVVKRDWGKAYYWMSRAAEAEFEPAKKAIQNLIERKLVSVDDTTGLKHQGMLAGEDSAAVRDTSEAATNAWTPIFIDFSRDSTTSEAVPTTQLIEELLASTEFTAADTLIMRALIDDEQPADTAIVTRLRLLANYGNPEAEVLLARMFEEGLLVRKNPFTAAAYYISAIYLDNFRAGNLLIYLLNNSSLLQDLEQTAYGGSAEAQYVWSGLKALDFDPRLPESLAYELLMQSAAQDHAKAYVQLGLCSFTGRWVDRDKQRAFDLWETASEMDSREGEIRIAASTVIGAGNRMDLHDALRILEEADGYGSLLARVALAYSYERGIGHTVDMGLAVKLYRDCAVRGSQNAYYALERLHDSIRPDELEFQIE